MQVNPWTNKNIKHVKEQYIVQEFHLNIENWENIEWKRINVNNTKFDIWI
jgi:hypothetical protein